MLDEILAMCWILEPSVPLSVMALHTSSRILAKKRCPPIKLACASEEELEDWVRIWCSKNYVHYFQKHLWALKSKSS